MCICILNDDKIERKVDSVIIDGDNDYDDDGDSKDKDYEVQPYLL